MPFYNGKKKECTEDSAPHPPILNYDEERSLPQTSYANFTIYMWTCGEENCQDPEGSLEISESDIHSGRALAAGCGPKGNN